MSLQHSNKSFAPNNRFGEKISIVENNAHQHFGCTNNLFIAKGNVVDSMSVKNNAVTNKMSTTLPKNPNVTNNAALLKKPTVTNNMGIPKNPNVTNNMTVRKNHNVTNDMTVPKNPTVTNNTSIPRNPGLTNNRSLPKNPAITNNRSLPKNPAVTNNIPKNSAVTNNMSVPNNMSLANNVSASGNNNAINNSVIQNIPSVECNINETLDVKTETSPNLSYPVKSKYTSNYITFLRNKIHNTITTDYLFGNPNFTKAPNVLNKLFDLYDLLFFKNTLKELINKHKVKLDVTYNSRLSVTGGFCKHTGSCYTIEIADSVILGTFQKGEKLHMAGGLNCYNRLECLMAIFEHELIHFIIGITHGHVKGDPIYKSHGKYFKSLLFAYFGQTETKHSLLLTIDIPGKKEDFKVGDIVSFTSRKRGLITGKIIKMNPQKAIVGQFSVRYAFLKHASETDINTVQVSVPTVVNPHNFKIGDIVSYAVKGETYTSKVIKVNAKTYTLDQHKISHILATPATKEQCNKYSEQQKSSPKQLSSNDFRVGQKVQFKSKTGEIVVGTIDKLNPKRAVVGRYAVPYQMLLIAV
jgi:hypothetical protein